jgi:hypothetical protein
VKSAIDYQRSLQYHSLKRSKDEAPGRKAPEDQMSKNLVLCLTISFLAGCGLSPFSSTVVAPTSAQQDEIIRGFGSTDSVIVGSEGYRVGWYYDFSGYDSLRINFSAKRLELGPEFDHILIRIGPACYLSDSLIALQQDFSLAVRRSEIAKPQFAALTFYVTDVGARLLLWQLRVTGWAAQ